MFSVLNISNFSPSSPTRRLRILKQRIEGGILFNRHSLAPLIQNPNSRLASASFVSRAEARRRHGQAGVLLVELMIAVAVIALVFTCSMAALLSSDREAAAYRVKTCARAIVERNIENALNVSFTSTTTPAILATTPAAGQAWDDDNSGDGLVNILIQNTAGTDVPLQGSLTRIVTAQSNPENATILCVTFKLTYNFRGRNYTTSMSTFRSIDDF